MMKKKIAILGAGNAGRHLLKEMKKESSEYEVIAFIDNIVEGEIEGVKVLKPEVYFERYREEAEAYFIAVGAQKTLKFMIDILRKYNAENIYMMHDIAGKCNLPLFEDGKVIPQRIREIRFCKEKPTLPYIEIPITDQCNLNCKGCLFACNFNEKSEHVSYEQIEKDAKRMAELFHDIPWVRILGGEPLMHPDLLKIFELYRETFPDSEIDLCTNGLLLLKMDASFYESLIKNRISIHISGYKPTYHMLDKIDALLKNYKLPYVILKREQFQKYYTTQPNNDMANSYENCFASACLEVYRGKLSSCSAIIAFEKFNQQFNTEYKITEGIDWFDIHAESIDAWHIKRALDHPSNMCKYCDTGNMVDYNWDYAGAEPKLNDYVIS